ncbi:ATP-binding protein [Brevundimonas sp. AAP58]|uniref:ATP-binding protein n=1 Tax=Brevundimonas sp. AAP58 TaxID=1523422 RepID=UPI0006B8BBE8|nr:ATP-binding protein [Brevundimonas sp. AAP58]
MVWLQRAVSSLVVRITALTVAALMAMFAVLLLLVQTSVAPEALYPRALTDNAESIAELVWLVENSPEEIQPFILSAYGGGYRTAAISEDFADGLQPRAGMRARLASSQSEVASRLTDREIRFQALGVLGLQSRLRQEGAAPLVGTAALQIAIKLKDGRIVNIWLVPALTLSRPSAALVASGFLLVLLSVALGLAIAAVTLRPIRRLELDAERVELGDAGSGVSETGPAELRRVSAALNRMRDRLTGLIREREQMVAAIAHDVRTGITRIRLRMDERGAVSAKEIEGDIAQMEALITDMLAYARAQSPSGPQELIRLDSFVADMSNAAPYPIKLVAPLDEDFVIVGDPVALHRLFENLMENARRYGGGKITVRVIATEGGREVRIEDDGPGLPEDQLETLFQPFQRGENSRNRATGGTGLGLGIARAIAKAHGASLHLENRPEGGLVAIVRFPQDLLT